ncbi:MAG: DEAD/DEAH box helicase, partial [Clostridia bacterium]|nr:DEAD/DEAH box helicase [Clostridia bacterium]
AEQHFETLQGMIGKMGVTCALLTGSMTKKQKAQIKQDLQEGKIDVAIGTHALLTDDVEFARLGLVITDEQHRFGVVQRGKLGAKGQNPHTLVMSATPIPRTLGLIIYGDLDVSILDEIPRGRQKIATYCVDSSYRERIYRFLLKQLREGRQAYVVCPLVEEEENSDLQSAEEYYENLKDGPFSSYSVGLLHGKMRPKDKETVMRRFAAGEIGLLVSTTVVEVGVDVPNATVMLIENAERFGLSQLHQLRGRVGRGVYASTCILISDSRSKDTLARLRIIQNHHDGFVIADEDLKLRGPGDFLGNRQHGLPEMRIADLFADREILHAAGLESERLFGEDPLLEKPEHDTLKKAIETLYKRLNEN